MKVPRRFCAKTRFLLGLAIKKRHSLPPGPRLVHELFACFFLLLSRFLAPVGRSTRDHPPGLHPATAGSVGFPLAKNSITPHSLLEMVRCFYGVSRSLTLLSLATLFLLLAAMRGRPGAEFLIRFFPKLSPSMSLERWFLVFSLASSRTHIVMQGRPSCLLRNASESEIWVLSLPFLGDSTHQHRRARNATEDDLRSPLFHRGAHTVRFSFFDF